MSNKKYSEEFKLDAISLVNEHGYTQVEAVRSLGIECLFHFK
ncbi:transposase, IS911 [Legionella beliardensis]|uniref:Transposase, IS911 n=1 Tax=Legionella beliardensis TaxID=91822 RepID=A0A378JP15_9GAMM|nr:transposase, IS911 [Legionella beliardensis]